MIAQESAIATKQDTLLIAAREIMTMNQYCALITCDSSGQPQARTMNPFQPDENMVVWIATNRDSRKVKEIQNNPHVCVYYADHKEAVGYVPLIGQARIVDDKDALQKMKRNYWEGIPDWQNIMVMIEIVPEKIEVINYKYNLVNASDTWAAPTMEF